MPLDQKTPGVYVEEVLTLPPSVAEVSTAVPAFVGYTQKAITREQVPLHLKPVKIFSLMDYENLFGTTTAEDNGLSVYIKDTYNGSNLTSRVIEAKINADDRDELSRHNLYYAMQLYFANGGGPCYVVSVGLLTETIVLNAVGDDNSGGLLEGLAALELEDEPTLIVIPEAVALSLSEMKMLYDAAIAQAAVKKDRFVLMDVKMTGNIVTDAGDFRTNSPTDNRGFGAAYYPYLETTVDYSYLDTGVRINHEGVPTTTTNYSGQLSELNAQQINNAANPKYNNGLYNQIKAALTQVPLRLPPSPAIAGVYARVDRDRGVWKAPANVGVYGIVAPSIKISDTEQQNLNEDISGKSINAIRSFPGQGTLVWGARTLDGNSNAWRFINVRRLFITIEESIQKATRFAVFEPNTASTWVKVKAMCESYLYGLWQQGALAGASSKEAYIVQVGLGQTMTANDVLNGRMIVEIGIAAVRPAEFIYLRFSHKMQES